MNVDDLIDSATASVGADGLVITRKLYRDGIGGSADQRLINALTAGGIVRYQSYPNQSALFCDTLNCVPCEGSNTKFMITATYKNMTPDQAAPSATTPAKLTISTTTQEFDTTRDKDGDAITIPYTAVGDKTAQSKTGTVKATRVILVLNYTRKEPDVPDMKLYTDRVNVAAIWGYPARTLLLAHTNAEITEDQVGVIMTYEFHYKDDTWDALVVANDPATGQPFTNINPASGNNNGYKIFQIKKTADFTGLNLA